jgi:hypothetical protein
MSETGARMIGKIPKGRLRVAQDCVLGHFQPSLRDWFFLSNPTQD